MEKSSTTICILLFFRNIFSRNFMLPWMHKNINERTRFLVFLWQNFFLLFQREKQLKKIIRTANFSSITLSPPSAITIRKFYLMTSGQIAESYREQLFFSYFNGYWWQLIFFRVKCAIITIRSSDFVVKLHLMFSLLWKNNYQFENCSPKKKRKPESVQ